LKRAKRKYLFFFDGETTHSTQWALSLQVTTKINRVFVTVNMEHIGNKNNIGVDHICNGRWEEARKAFKSALIYLISFHQQQQQDGRQSRCNFLIHIENQCIPDSPDPTSPSNNFYMYRNVMRTCLRSNSKSKHNMMEQNKNCLAVLITFNLCLTLHYKFDRELHDGPILPNNDQQNKLLLLYKNVWKELLIDTRKLPRHQAYRDTISFVVLNNMGGIYHQQDKKQKARKCFQTLKNLISCAHCRTIAPDVRNGIMTNISLLETNEKTRWKVLPLWSINQVLSILPLLSPIYIYGLDLYWCKDLPLSELHLDFIHRRRDIEIFSSFSATSEWHLWLIAFLILWFVSLVISLYFNRTSI